MNSINNEFALIYNTCNQSLLLLEIIYLRAYSLIHSSLIFTIFFTSSDLVGSTVLLIHSITNSVLIYNTWNRSLQYTGSSLLAYILSYTYLSVIGTFIVRPPLIPDFFDFQRLQSNLFATWEKNSSVFVYNNNHFRSSFNWHKVHYAVLKKNRPSANWTRAPRVPYY